MGIIDIFKPLRKSSVQRWKELGTYKSTFTVFGEDIYQSELVRSCIRPLADFSSKAEAKCDDARLERILNNRPNMYMNGKDFLYKIRTRMELLNTAFIYLQRDDRGKVIGLYPVPYSYFEAVEYMNGLFIKFYFSGENQTTLTLAWDDLAVVRKDYNKSDIAGDDNLSIVKTLEMINTTNQGLANSIKATANLRGILKSTKAMLAPEAIKAQKDQFVNDYLNLENKGGIASLDSTQEFTPININPVTASAEQMKELRDDVFRYFGVNDEIIMGNVGSSEMLENFYRLRIEPFLVELSRELTSKIYPKQSAAWDKHEIIYQADQFAFVTLDKKIQLFSTVVLYGGMTIDEWRSLFNLPHIEGGDTPIRRLDAADINSAKAQQGSAVLDQEEIDAEDDVEADEDLEEDDVSILNDEEEDDIDAQFEKLKKDLGM